jgi:Leucine-rich repeat (LRR) protein
MFSASKLETIAVLQDLSNSLEEIQIEQCKKIDDFEILGKIKSLKKIILSESGEIKSLAFVKSLILNLSAFGNECIRRKY